MAIRAQPTTLRALVAATREADAAAASRAPRSPEGHRSHARGARAKARAASAIGHAPRPAISARTRPTSGATAEATSDTRPTTVVTTTKGVATRFAATAYGPMPGFISTITGVHTICAERGTAITRARPGVTTRASDAARIGDQRAMAPVARTESAKP